MPELITPDAQLRTSFVEAMEEFAAEGRGRPDDTSMIGRDLREQRASWADAEGFASYVGDVVADGLDASPRPPGFVPSTTMWWVDEDVYLGRIAIRHRLNDWLREYGGHIGYDVRRSARRQGHATAMLRAALPYARNLGIESALITCDEDNVASRRVVEAAGGVLEDARTAPGQKPKLRYWVATGP